MEYYGIFKGDNLILVCGSKEKAEQMQENHPGAEVFPVEEINREWVKKNPNS